jgi:hypothetical protein
MKHQNNVFTAMVVALAFALAPIVCAEEGGGLGTAVPPYSSTAQAGPLISVHSIADVHRGKTGAFVLQMQSTRLLGGTYVKFAVSGTAVPGVDYVLLVSPAYIGQSGYGLIEVQTLPDPRGFSHQAYSLTIKLEDGAGYAVGQPSSATMWILP